ncbi:unnamed protein product [Didymodactylos carnosus]|nr:unnamed protein product [Didymodactylos carnosus]CAF3643744.1 unnamed protein product [Didymodactylos carnosus]
MSNDDERLLNSILTPIVNDDNEQGWEEYVDASLTFALRTMLSRSSTKGDLIPASSATFNNSTLNIDVTKLKKRIQMFCDRLEKGASLTSNSSSVTFEEKNHDDHQVPKKKNIINGVKPVVQHRDVPSYDNNDQMENKLLPMNEQHSDYDDET